MPQKDDTLASLRAMAAWHIGTDLPKRLAEIDARMQEMREALGRAAEQIERLQSRLRFADGVIRSGDVAALTEAEQEALDWACGSLEDPDTVWDDNYDADAAAVLRALMKRMGDKR